ncbi:uncharacterized protein LOC111032274 [Myzus persicae]|uniref:uncharacterized protein LOC111032274 n=1 Tax=Myzus persicae TaxID=13164 RepID=UPI000B934364|nr:uncharacterized protein LOC111032274 [Myzus persicae]
MDATQTDSIKFVGLSHRSLLIAALDLAVQDVCRPPLPKKLARKSQSSPELTVLSIVYGEKNPVPHVSSEIPPKPTRGSAWKRSRRCVWKCLWDFFWHRQNSLHSAIHGKYIRLHFSKSTFVESNVFVNSLHRYDCYSATL